MNVLVLGFEPFRGHAENPSGRFAEAIHGRTIGAARILGDRLPVAWNDAWSTARRRLDSVRPRAVIEFGVCDSPEFRIELLARNRAAGSDELGAEPPVDSDRRIVTGGPATYDTALPVDLLTVDQPTGPSIRLSEDAGSFLCNYVFYLTRHNYGSLVPIQGFVHVPPLRSSRFPAGADQEDIDATCEWIVTRVAESLGQRTAAG